MIHRCSLIICTLAISGCSGDNIIDPTLLGETFTGITYTNEIGEIVGAVDSTDWNLTQSPVFPRDSGSILLPSKFAVQPAFPNPFSASIKFKLELPIATEYSLRIFSSDGKQVHSISGLSDAGVVAIEFSAERFPDGVYRVVYKLRTLPRYGDLSGHGDIWKTANPQDFR